MHFLLVHLDDGRVSFTFKNLGGSQQATSVERYDDTQLHTLQFTCIRGQILFAVDGREQPAISGFEGKVQK